MTPFMHLTQCWNIADWTLSNKFQWNLDHNTIFFIEENAFENVVSKISTISSPELLITKRNSKEIYLIWLPEVCLQISNGGREFSHSMALAHPLHPIKSRSRNKRRHPWVRLCLSWCCTPSVYRTGFWVRCSGVECQYLLSLLILLLLSWWLLILLTCLYPWLPHLNPRFRFPETLYFASAIARLLGCFCPWTFF